MPLKLSLVATALVIASASLTAQADPSPSVPVYQKTSFNVITYGGGQFQMRHLTMNLIPGSAQLAPPPGGAATIDSFFDIFTELSFNGGGSWAPFHSIGHDVEHYQSTPAFDTPG